RPLNNNNPTDVPAFKKPRLDIDHTTAELKTMDIQLVDSLRASMATTQWGDENCRNDTMANITKAQCMILACSDLEHGSKEASATVDKLIDALIDSEIRHVSVALRTYATADEARCESKTIFVEGILKCDCSITQLAKLCVKEKLQGLPVDAIIDRIEKETKLAYASVTQKKFFEVLEGALGVKRVEGTNCLPSKPGG
ncbi:unnamed protein product, partial [Aureobasidium vineae]